MEFLTFVSIEGSIRDGSVRDVVPKPEGRDESIEIVELKEATFHRQAYVTVGGTKADYRQLYLLIPHSQGRIHLADICLIHIARNWSGY
jgi:hypothetical protein